MIVFSFITSALKVVFGHDSVCMERWMVTRNGLHQMSVLARGKLLPFHIGSVRDSGSETKSSLLNDLGEIGAALFYDIT